MKVLCVYLAACLALTVANHKHDNEDHEAENKDCSNPSEEVLEKIKKQLVSADVHEQLVGEFSQVWGAKQFLEEDSETCVKITNTKLDDKIINQELYYKFKLAKGGEKTTNQTLEKLDSGIYIIKKGDGTPVGKLFMLFAKDDVLAYYICMYNQPKPNEQEEPKKKLKQLFFSAVLVNSKDAKSALDGTVQENVDLAVKKIQSDPELFGEIQQYTNFC